MGLRQGLRLCIFKKPLQVILMFWKAQHWSMWLLFHTESPRVSRFSEAQIQSNPAFSPSSICCCSFAIIHSFQIQGSVAFIRHLCVPDTVLKMLAAKNE